MAWVQRYADALVLAGTLALQTGHEVVVQKTVEVVERLRRQVEVYALCWLRYWRRWREEEWNWGVVRAGGVGMWMCIVVYRRNAR